MPRGVERGRHLTDISPNELHIGKYLSRLRKLDHAIVLKVGFEP